MDDENDDIDPNEAVSATASSMDEVKFPEAPLDEGGLKTLSHESVAPQNSYQIKPSFQDTFKKVPVRDIIQNVQYVTLDGRTYDPDSAKKWTIKMANEINEKIKDIGMKRYRHIVQIVLGERKGQGVKSGVRCIWDSEIDTYCSEIYMNDTIFCVVTVFAVFLY